MASGAKRLDHARAAARRQQRQADLRIGRAGQGAEAVGRDDMRPRGPSRVSSSARARQRAHHAVDLRPPGVGDDEDAHQLGGARGCDATWQHRELAHRRPVDDLAAGRRDARPGRCSSPPSRRRCSRGCRRSCGSRPCGYGRRPRRRRRAARLLGHRVLVVADELDRVLDLVLQVGRERPVGVAEHGGAQVEPVVDARAAML